MNMIILAAIALIVLVVLSVIFIGRGKKFSSEVGGCEQKNGKCTSKTDGCNGPNMGQMSCNDDQFCCLNMGEG